MHRLTKDELKELAWVALWDEKKVFCKVGYRDGIYYAWHEGQFIAREIVLLTIALERGYAPCDVCFPLEEEAVERRLTWRERR